jgi:hypothetical protein
MMFLKGKSSGFIKVKPPLIILLSFGLLLFSINAHGQRDSLRRPPPHPKPPSLKEMFSKINPFKKHKDTVNANSSKTDAHTEAAVKPPAPEPVQPVPAPPAPKPPPAVAPKTVHKKKTLTKKKTIVPNGVPNNTPPPKKTDKTIQPLI